MAALFQAGADIRSLEEFAEGYSSVHRLPAAAKLITTFVYVVLVVSFDRYKLSGLVAFISYPVLATALAGLSCKALFKRLIIALPFALLGGLANLYFDRALAFEIANIGISYGFISFCSILLKTLFSVWAVLILISTTSLADISDCLIRLKVPQVFVLSFMMTYRYLSLLIEEAASMHRAYSLRSGSGRGIKFGNVGLFIGQLLIRSIDRAERVYVAMKCRGFEGMYYPQRKGELGLVYIALVCCVLLILRFINVGNIMGGVFF